MKKLIIAAFATILMAPCEAQTSRQDTASGTRNQRQRNNNGRNRNNNNNNRNRTGDTNRMNDMNQGSPYNNGRDSLGSGNMNRR